jgi:hypothetical protein
MHCEENRINITCVGRLLLIFQFPDTQNFTWQEAMIRREVQKFPDGTHVWMHLGSDLWVWIIKSGFFFVIYLFAFKDIHRNNLSKWKIQWTLLKQVYSIEQNLLEAVTDVKTASDFSKHMAVQLTIFNNFCSFLNIKIKTPIKKLIYLLFKCFLQVQFQYYNLIVV